MHILLIAATAGEIQDSTLHLEKNDFRIGKNSVQVSITGIGLVATAYALGKTIFGHAPDLVLQAGIAGCFEKHRIGNTVVVREDCFADMGVRESGQFKNIFDLGLADSNDAPFTNGRLLNPHQKLLSLSGLDMVRSVSVNEISTIPQDIERYQQNFSPFVESMEGAAFHYVCLKEAIHFLQLRSVSNFIGERDKSKWNIKEAVRALNEQLIILLDKLKGYDED